MVMLLTMRHGHFQERFRAEYSEYVKKNVLIIVENLPVPFDTRVWKEALALTAHGYAVVVICPVGAGFEARFEILEGVHIYRHPMPHEGRGILGYMAEYGAALFWETLLAWRVFFKHRFDVIQGCNPPDTIFLVALPFKLFGVKYIFDHHDVVPELYMEKFGRTGLVYKVQRWLEKLTFITSDVVMATNESYKNIAVTRGRRRSADVFVVRNGPDIASFRAVRPNPDLKHGKDYLVGYVGTMGAQEGIDLLVEVALCIKKWGRDDVHFTCAGGGPELEKLRILKSTAGLDEIFDFTGQLDQAGVIELISTADVCVSPDRPGQVSNVSTMIKIPEYMALAKPIVQFDLREGRCSAQESSLYAECGEVEDFANKILWLLDNPSARQKMGEVGAKRVRDKLAWHHSVPHLLNAYARALEGREASSVSPNP